MNVPSSLFPRCDHDSTIPFAGFSSALGLFTSSLQATDDAAVILKKLKDRGAEVTCDQKGEVFEIKLINPGFRNDDWQRYECFHR